MRMLVAICLLLLIAAPGPAASPQSQPSSEKAASRPASPQRVILKLGRDHEVRGHIELEENDVIVIRTLAGQVESFSKIRILQIVRLVDPEPGQRGVVVMSDGGSRDGIIIEDAFDHVLIEIEGIRAKLRRDTVSHVVLEPTFDQKYAQYKAALQPGMVEAHLHLCRWLVEQRRYELAQAELDELLRQADQPEARQLMKLVQAQLALRERPQRTTDSDQGDGQTPPGDEGGDESGQRASGPVFPADILPSQILTDQDVNIIRVYEIDFDHPTRVTVTPDLVRELIEKYGTDKLIPATQSGRNALFRAAADKPLDVVRLMFELRARDLYPKIQVNSEPYAFNMFRQRVHDTWLINNCATSRCHGGLNAGRFFLHRRNYKDERVRYANFLILERLSLDPEWPLINYDDPEMSLIIQYALPREEARKPHPNVNGFSAPLNRGAQRLKRDAIQWIRSMMIPRPDYPVVYDLPRLRDDVAATSPASDQDRTSR